MSSTDRIASRLAALIRLAPFPLCAAILGACAVAPACAQYTLMRANLHAHTDYSDDVSSDPSTVTPGAAAAAARANGLNAFSTSDHGEYLSDAKWANTKTQMAQATVPGQFVALWGFEWTASLGGFAPTATGKGHFGVYGSANQTGLTDNGANTLPSSRWTTDVYWRNVGGQLSHSGTFYGWLTDAANRTSPLGGGIVGQFNHPSLYPNVSFANPSSHWTNSGSQIVVQDWWRKLEFVPEADPYMTLMEMGSRTIASSQTGGCLGGAYNEPYFQLALDNGWHVSPTNNEDNHTDSYGASKTRTTTIAGAAQVETVTGIWAEAEPANGTAAGAQAKLLAALRERRTFSSEDPAGPHTNGTVIQWTVNTVSDGVKWMGARTLKPGDVEGGRLHLEVTRAVGLTLQSVEVVTNRGVVAKALPLSGAGVTINGSKYAWDFGVPADAPGAQLRACSDVQAALPFGSYARPPLPSPSDTSSLGVVLNAAASSHIERYYYIRVISTDGTQPYYAFSAPVWIARAPKAPVSYRWDFGDGATKTETPPATPDTPFGEQRHTYAATGTYYPRVVVAYSDGTSEAAVTRVVLGGQPAGPLYGDVNGDGQVNALDLSLLARASAGMLAVSDAGQFARANVAPAGSPPGGTTHLDITDVLRLNRFLNGLGTAWP
jgi:hypothetical protein